MVAPSVYSESAYPEARALMIPRFVMVCATVVIGWLIGWSIARFLKLRSPFIHLAAALFLALLCLYPIRMAWYASWEIPAFQSRAAEWDARAAIIRQLQDQGKEDILIAGMNSANGLMEMNDNPSTWVNVCAARYYGVESLTATP